MTRSDQAARVTRVLSENAPDLLRHLQRRLEYDDAADALGEVMAIAWRRCGAIPIGAEQARMWLFVVARNVVANGLRGYRRHRILTADLRAALLAAPRSGPAADAGDEIRDAIERLDPQHAELVRLIHWDGFSIAEAATILEINASTARTRYQRAKERLRASLAESHPHDPALRPEDAPAR